MSYGGVGASQIQQDSRQKNTSADCSIRRFIDVVAIHKTMANDRGDGAMFLLMCFLFV